MLWTVPAATDSVGVTTKSAVPWACAEFHLLYPFTWGYLSQVSGHWKAVKRFYIRGISMNTFLPLSQNKKKNLKNGSLKFPLQQF